MLCAILQHVDGASDSADASGLVLSNEVSKIYSDGCFLTPQCHKSVYFIVVIRCIGMLWLIAMLCVTEPQTNLCC